MIKYFSDFTVWYWWTMILMLRVGYKNVLINHAKENKNWALDCDI